VVRYESVTCVQGFESGLNSIEVSLDCCIRKGFMKEWRVGGQLMSHQ
jgi:hypothetical protein